MRAIISSRVLRGGIFVATLWRMRKKAKEPKSEPKSGRANLDHTVRVRVSEDEWEKWQCAAQKANFTTVSEWIRHAMRLKVSLDGLDGGLQRSYKS